MKRGVMRVSLLGHIVTKGFCKSTAVNTDAALMNSLVSWLSPRTYLVRYEKEEHDVAYA